MPWYCWKYPHLRVTDKQLKMRGRNTNISHHHYSEDTNIGKVICAICHIPCVCPARVAKIDKDWLPHCDPLYQPRCDYVENCFYNK